MPLITSIIEDSDKVLFVTTYNNLHFSLGVPLITSIIEDSDKVLFVTTYNNLHFYWEELSITSIIADNSDWYGPNVIVYKFSTFLPWGASNYLNHRWLCDLVLFIIKCCNILHFSLGEPLFTSNMENILTMGASIYLKYRKHSPYGCLLLPQS